MEIISYKTVNNLQQKLTGTRGIKKLELKAGEKKMTVKADLRPRLNKNGEIENLILKVAKKLGMNIGRKYYVQNILTVNLTM